MWDHFLRMSSLGGAQFRSLGNVVPGQTWFSKEQHHWIRNSSQQRYSSSSQGLKKSLIGTLGGGNWVWWGEKSQLAEFSRTRGNSGLIANNLLASVVCCLLAFWINWERNGDLKKIEWFSPEKKEISWFLPSPDLEGIALSEIIEISQIKEDNVWFPLYVEFLDSQRNLVVVTTGWVVAGMGRTYWKVESFSLRWTHLSISCTAWWLDE